MTIDIFVLFRKIYGLNLEFHSYLISWGGLYSRGLIFGGEFVLVSRGFYSKQACAAITRLTSVEYLVSIAQWSI